MHVNKNLHPHLQRWIYPIVIIFVIFLLSCFKINGSSVGMYHEYFYGDTTKDSNLIFGQPQQIRSDEWLVMTQLSLAQKETNYSQINKNFLDKDISLFADAPYREWSMLFKPQNALFYVAPFENAFAFKWWSILGILLISSYFFFLRVLRGSIIKSILLSIIIGFSPFMFWWYQSSTVLSLGFAFAVILFCMNIIAKKRFVIGRTELSENWSIVVWTALLSYCSISFSLLLYPPFQIAVLLVVAFFVIGYLLSRRQNVSWKKILLSFGATLIIAGGVCGAFLLTRSDAVTAMTSTVYPGKRVISSGGYDINRLLVTYLQPQLQRPDRGPNYIANQSESSSFIVMPLLLVVPAFAILYARYRNRGEIDWILLSLLACLTLFMCHYLIPGMDILSKLSFLSLVPQPRIIIGLGLLAIIMLAYIIRFLDENRLIFRSKRWYFCVVAYTAAILAVSIYEGFQTIVAYPGFLSNKLIVVALASVLCVAFGLIFLRYFKLGLALIVVLTLSSVAYIHPLYSGMGIIGNNKVFEAIKEISHDNSRWAVAENIYIENFPQLAGRASITGVHIYPNTKLLGKYSTPSDEEIYNRYAHILVADHSERFQLVVPDRYTISGECTNELSRTIDFIISIAPSPFDCDILVKSIPYPNVTFYIYQRQL